MLYIFLDKFCIKEFIIHKESHIGPFIYLLYLFNERIFYFSMFFKQIDRFFSADPAKI